MFHHPGCRAGSSAATSRGASGVASSASLAAACKERCAKLLCLLGPLHPANGSQAAQHWLQQAPEPGQARDLPCVLLAARRHRWVPSMALAILPAGGTSCSGCRVQPCPYRGPMASRAALP